MNDGLNLKELQKHGVEGFTGFSIKAEDTEENKGIHDAFKDYCLHKTKNDYTQGLRLLLETAIMSEELNQEKLMERIIALEGRIALLEAKPVVEEKKQESF